MLGYVKILSIATIIQYVRLCACLNNYITEHGISNVGGQDSLTSQLTSIMERLTSIDQRFNALDQRVTALDQRVTTLNQQVNTLDNRVSDMQQRSGHATGVNNILMTSTTVTPSATPTASKTFRITKVTKTELADSYKVRVDYEASSKPTFVLLRRSYRDAAELLENQDIGVVEVQVPKKGHYLDDHTLLTFSYPDLYVMAYLQMNNTPNSVEVPHITAEIAQRSDLTFQPGSLPELDFTLKVDGDMEAVKEDRIQCQVMLKSDTEESRVDSYYLRIGSDKHTDSPVWLDLVSQQGLKGDRHATIRINSTLEDPRGILMCTASVGFNCTENCLVYQLDSAATIRFYRDDHSGPFPEGFLGFVHHKHTADPSRVLCDVSDPGECLIDCEVEGSDPSTAELTKILPSGDVVPTDDLEVSDERWSYSQLKIVNVTFADAGDYRCTAKSGSKEITRDISLVVIKAARINKNLAFVTEWVNGSLSATCTAEGNPAPSVTFDTEFYPLSDASPGDYDVTMTKLDESKTRADIVVINPDVASNIYSFDCRATNVDNLDKYGLHIDYYSIYVNEEDNYAN